MDPSKAVAAFPTDPKLLDAFLDEGQKQGVDPALALSMGWWESRGQWKHEASSGAGAHGIMQLTADTASKFGVKDPKDADPVENVRAGVRVIKYLFDKYPKSRYGDKQLDYVVAAYNRGETKLNKDIRAGVSFDAFPVETRDYLVAVHTLMPQFTVLLAEREKKAKQAASGGAAKK
jgi:soluble lytic murein transglycosylase-like protein